jgi:glycosyltransferase involved in cell wall biosynthesis
MRITFVLPSYAWKPIGGFRVVYEYANGLIARGHEVSIVHPRRLGPARPPTGSLYRRIRWRAAKLRDWAFRPSVHWQHVDRKVRMQYAPGLGASNVPEGDVIFATAWQTAEYVANYPASKGRKFYLIMDFAPWLGPRDQIEATWRQPLRKITISRWLYEQVCSATGDLRNTVNIPIAIDHRRFRITADINRRAKQVTMYYGYAGYKAAGDGISALDIARRRHQDMRVEIFGQLSRKPQDVPPWAFYHGNISEGNLIDIYNRSAIFLCSSVAEGFALPPAEALACGCAVVSTDCGGIREFARQEVTALLSPPHDPPALASNLIRLLDDDNLRRRLAADGNHAIREFTWNRSTDQLEKFIRAELAAAAGGQY